MGRILLEVDVANNVDVAMVMAGISTLEKVRHVRIQGVVDSGAQYLVLPESVARQLDLPVIGSAPVRYADQRTAVRPMVGQVQLELVGRTGIFRAFLEPDRTTALIGAIVLEDLDLLVDCTRQVVYPRDPNTIIAEVE